MLLVVSGRLAGAQKSPSADTPELFQEKVAMDRTDPTFNIVPAAGLYSQCAGVLAGFAFTALILLLTARLTIPGSTGPADFSSSARVLVATLLGLILTSFNYAVITGITASRTRLAVLENLAGVVFVISAVLLFYSVALTIDAVNGASSIPDLDMISVAKNLRRLIAVVIVPAVAFFISNAINDIVKSTPEVKYADLYSWGTVVIQVIAGSASYLYLTRASAPTMSKIDREKAIERLSEWGFGLIMTFSLAFATYNQFPDVDGVLVAVFAYFLATFVLLVGLVSVVHLARTRP
ncbi:hypothetical protein ACIA5G_39320 [Amycolatopsis sp. NPDC051758]|uniref:hypothetical protein n=1 Tax=Amycolatopsis sp. NPDC051758 TaxID=3363935 RepID=UPI0037B5A386